MAADYAQDGRLTMDRERPREHEGRQRGPRRESAGSVLERLLRGIEPHRERAASGRDLHTHGSGSTS